MQNPLDDFQHFNSGAAELCRVAEQADQTASLALGLKDLNERLVRFYVSEGVLDKPERDGREARYHFRHLIQLLVCKTLLQDNFPLHKIAEFTSQSTTQVLKNRLSSASGTRKTTAELLVSAFKNQSRNTTGSQHAQPSPAQVNQAAQNLRTTAVLDPINPPPPPPRTAPAPTVDLLAELQQLRNTQESMKEEVAELRRANLHFMQAQEQQMQLLKELLDMNRHTEKFIAELEKARRKDQVSTESQFASKPSNGETK